ncbi:hypothetical protein GCM10010919_15460 [Alishewanella longhuensis]|uniref:Transglutaminase-like domain-containing protein n=1 Tax=Alishewanella longhuensis TaxID=1091037 RepID=A0ABQ3L1G9_9ALTE|nr:transglutaminase family protein [Alishewanella longhuensis]GHG67048.1 hypothetical protein GCM10010919_15460 [Alishewanella longhuensis]
MKYQLQHLTEYLYQHPVANSYNLACLTPRDLSYQEVKTTALHIYPTGAEVSQYQDYFGNIRHFIHLQAPHQQLSVVSHASLEVLPRRNNERLQSGCSATQLQSYLQHSKTAAAVYAKMLCQPSSMAPISAEAGALLAPLRRQNQTVLELAEQLNQYIYANFIYTPGFTTVVTPLSDVIKYRRGVCQDFALLAISCLRANGIPARYVSGYLETQPLPGQPRLQGADASHAWFSVFDPELGWVDFDPTNNLLPCQQHLTVAFGRDYADVVPLKGVVQGSGNHQLKVAVDVVQSA